MSWVLTTAASGVGKLMICVESLRVEKVDVDLTVLHYNLSYSVIIDGTKIIIHRARRRQNDDAENQTSCPDRFSASLNSALALTSTRLSKCIL